MSAITIEVKGQTFTLTREQARALHQELCALFGAQEPAQRNAPSSAPYAVPLPYYPVQPPQWPWDMPPITCKETPASPFCNIC